MFKRFSCRDPLARIDGQHLVDEILRLRRDSIPFRTGILKLLRTMRHQSDGRELYIDGIWIGKQLICLGTKSIYTVDTGGIGFKLN